MARTTKDLNFPRPKRASPRNSLLVASLASVLLAAGGGIAVAQPTTTPTPSTTTTTAPPTTTTTAPPTTPSTEVPAPERLAPNSTEVTKVPAASTPTTLPPSAAETPAAPPSAESATPTTSSPETTTSTPGKKEPFVKWTPTENPNSTIIPGRMRSDRQELPEGFTKEEADKAEVQEAQTLAASRSRNARSSATTAFAAAAPTDCMNYWPRPDLWVCGEIRVKYDSLGGAGSFLLWPTSNELVNPDLFGRRQTF